MSKRESKGLEPEDLSLIFPDEEIGEPCNPWPAGPPQRDYKKAQAGDDEPWPEPPEEMKIEGEPNLSSRAIAEMAGVGHTFVDSLRPPLASDANATRATKDGRQYPATRTGKSSEEAPREQEVEMLAQKACRPMIDSVVESKPPIMKRVKGETSPSDEMWIETIKRILWPAGPSGSSAPCPGGSVRPSIKGQDEEKQR